jgi:hypothetical protein
MSEFKGTPGPWRFVFETGYTNVYADNGKKLICEGVVPTPGVGDLDANARLIESAPDLLAALQTMTQMWQSYIPPDSYDGHAAEAYRRASAAIEKATGK